MLFYIIQLFDLDYKDDMILGMTTAGILKGTYLEGENLDHMLNQDFPIFKGFFKTKEDKERASALFFGTTESKESLENLAQVMKDAGIENTDGEVFHIMSFAGDEII